jgi:hypothetical protein
VNRKNAMNAKKRRGEYKHAKKKTTSHVKRRATTNK